MARSKPGRDALVFWTVDVLRAEELVDQPSEHHIAREVDGEGSSLRRCRCRCRHLPWLVMMGAGSKPDVDI
jgi:hypothetical protein